MAHDYDNADLALWRRPAWHELASCRGADTAQFFIAEQGRNVDASTKAICARCPVRQICFEYATNFPERHGYWGGASERTRRLERRRRRDANRELPDADDLDDADLENEVA